MRSFPITDPHVVPQYNKVMRVLYDYKKYVHIVYQSNWYITIACIDVSVAEKIILKIVAVGAWTMEQSPGKQGRYHYIKLKFNQEI